MSWSSQHAATPPVARNSDERCGRLGARRRKSPGVASWLTSFRAGLWQAFACLLCSMVDNNTFGKQTFDYLLAGNLLEPQVMRDTNQTNRRRPPQATSETKFPFVRIVKYLKSTGAVRVHVVCSAKVASRVASQLKCSLPRTTNARSGNVVGLRQFHTMTNIETNKL